MDYQAQEQAEVGRALIEDLAAYFGCEPNMERIKRSIYKNTACGAWIEIDESGLHLGSIVEGSDAEVYVTPLTWAEYLKMDEGDLSKWLGQALAYIEDEADILWHEANDAEVREEGL